MNKLMALASAAVMVAACESGDINLQPTNIDNSTTTGGGGGGGSNPCAAYTTSGGAERRGVFDGENCTYPSTFVSFSNPLRVDLDIPAIDGAHIFQDVLAVGQNVSSGTAPAGGTGPVLTIEAGATLAFSDNTDYVVINRGSQIIADGAPAIPITFTSVSDIEQVVGPEDVQEWGGIIINGNGITNNCSDAQRLSNDCHVVSEGQPVHYGGNDNSESSGTLRYVVVKHTGAEVTTDNELNGITFNSVGSGTTVSHIQTYSTYDDGIEFFGGAVNVDHFVAVYVRDDSIDFSDGYVGTIDTALVIQSQLDGNRCIEGDNIGDTRAAAGVPLDTLPMTNPTITRMTCIISASDTGTHPDVSEGPTLRRGPQMQLANSIVFGGYQDDAGDNNECFELAGDGVTNNWAATGDSTVVNTLIACDFAVQTSSSNRMPNGDSVTEWLLGLNPSTNGANYSFNTGNAIVQDPALSANANAQILDCFYTPTELRDAAGNVVTFPEAIGAVTRAADWTVDWAYGLHDGNRGQALWIEGRGAGPGGPCAL